MKKMLFTTVLLSLSLTANAQDYRDLTLRFASTSPQGTPQVDGMELFKEKVENRSNGQIEIKLYPNGVLGGDAQVMSSLQGGVVDMMVWNAGNLSRVVPDFAVFDLPFIFTDSEVIDNIVDGDVGSYLLEELNDHRLVGLAYWEQGFRYLTNNVRPVEDINDLEGLSVRVQEAPIFIDMWRSLGANPVPLSFTELYTALETGAVDGQENPAPLILASGMDEVQQYLTVTKHNYNPQAVIIGMPAWQKLNEDEQKLIREAALDTRLEQREISRKAEEIALEEILNRGVQVSYLTDEALENFKVAVEEVNANYLSSMSDIVADGVVRN